MGLPAGILFPESILQSPLITVLAAFVAVNTVIYATLAIAKLFPIVRWGDFFPGRRRRSETRSIFPESKQLDGGREPKGAHVGAVSDRLAGAARQARVRRSKRGAAPPNPHGIRGI
ncbi:hypothetical protein [Frigoribacterium sp. CG_9.8]|uniref:hypothetical protein n=1 Tax=Frigoribacterium sp. CG_9.8 TaxID=2787733 RepID=UPI0018CAE015|nr:hypothetical protein [Frigoribacterium sp. CG_9.8]MBG6107361.1 hypothetical protein [Frigoribacterium sp. CG_9.8]